jgi:hypothetical protein
MVQARSDAHQMALVVAILVLGLIVIAGFAVSHSVETRAREAVVRDLDGLTSPYRVTLNGRDVSNPSFIVDAIRRVAFVSAHHSGPTRPVRVEITDGTHIAQLTLAQDSERPDEFWILRPGGGISALPPFGQEDGRIHEPGLRPVLGDQFAR